MPSGGVVTLRVVILGGLGFVGSHLAESLVHDNHDVVIVSKSLSKAANVAAFRDRVSIELVDITRLSALAKIVSRIKPEVIVHLAGQLTTYESFERPLYDVDVNAKTTLALLEAVRKLGRSCRLVLGSTFWVIGRPRRLPVNEQTPCNPRNVYAANRLASEHYCRIYNEIYDMDTVVMRFTNTFGPREQKDNRKKAAINYLIYKAFRGQPITIYGNGKFFRDVIYVSDVVAGARRIIDKGKSGETYFVGSGRRTWFFQIGKWIHDLTGAPIEFVAPPDYHRRVDVGNFLVDNTKLKSLGWRCKVPVRAGIEKTLEHYKRET